MNKRPLSQCTAAQLDRSDRLIRDLCTKVKSITGRCSYDVTYRRTLNKEDRLCVKLLDVTKVHKQAIKELGLWAQGTEVGPHFEFRISQFGYFVDLPVRDLDDSAPEDVKWKSATQVIDQRRAVTKEVTAVAQALLKEGTNYSDWVVQNAVGADLMEFRPGLTINWFRGIASRTHPNNRAVRLIEMLTDYVMFVEQPGLCKNVLKSLRVVELQLEN